MTELSKAGRRILERVRAKRSLPPGAIAHLPEDQQWLVLAAATDIWEQQVLDGDRHVAEREQELARLLEHVQVATADWWVRRAGLVAQIERNRELLRSVGVIAAAPTGMCAGPLEERGEGLP